MNSIGVVLRKQSKPNKLDLICIIVVYKPVLGLCCTFLAVCIHFVMFVLLVQLTANPVNS